uniref:Galactokinase N-terminal domain-containing protein n=1 Tax=Parascaris equorum TaxID=6256 RepID=A0A914S0B9_PAREQ
MDEEKLKAVFKEHFHTDPEYIVRCPGRVNLIGEHVDYSGYGVFPMAIDAATYVLISRREESGIDFYNTDGQYPWMEWSAELAELCAHAEHYIGTESGGMDQAIEVLAMKGHAMLIEFNPLRWTA